MSGIVDATALLVTCALFSEALGSRNHPTVSRLLLRNLKVWYVKTQGRSDVAIEINPTPLARLPR